MAATYVLGDTRHRFLISTITFLMAFLVAQTRVESGVHSTLEVAYGGLVGALNKVDRLKPGHNASQMQVGARLGEFHALHPVSAKTGDGIGELREELVLHLPEGPRYFPEDERTDLSLELQVSELVREKALELTREEVPHAVSVEVEELEERVVRASVFVETESQKQIVVGRGGSVVKEIGVRARPEVERLLGRNVFLELHVKVRPRWRRDEAMLERLGI